jgi:predicted outer membrane repeat protein
MLALMFLINLGCSDKSDDTLAGDGAPSTADTGDDSLDTGGADTGGGGEDDGGGADAGALTDADGDGWPAAEDCDDADASVHPGAEDLCDGVDNNCSGDESDAVDRSTWYLDSDQDGFGQAAQILEACEQPAGYAAADGDCDDSDAAYNPGAAEDDCSDPNDYNCDGSVGYQDADGDGFAACEECDDGDRAVFPGAEEICDEIDNDCNGSVDEGVNGTFYADSDGDGYGNPALYRDACEAPAGYVDDNTDCNDSSGAANPDADEVCDNIDNNCDGHVDEDAAVYADAWFRDADGDGYGDAATTRAACDQPAGYVASASDCDDGAAGVNPGASETCDEEDDDCDGDVDEGVTTTFYADSDGDGFGDASTTTEACALPADHVAIDGPGLEDCDDDDSSVHPGARELCDGIDSDCDGVERLGVFFEDDTGRLTDLQEDYDFDDPSAVVALTMTEDGTLSFCEEDTFNVSIEVDTEQLRVVGLDREGTVLDAGGAGSVIYGEDAALEVEALTLTGGVGTACYDGHTCGGGLYLDGGSADLSDVLVTRNAAYDGAGVYTHDSALTITDSALTRNDGDYRGGGLSVDGGGAVVTDTEISDNTSDYGAGFWGYAGAELELSGVEVVDNVADIRGAGFYIHTDSAARFTDSRIAGNVASAVDGGGAYVARSLVELTGTEVSDNSAADEGGGMVLDESELTMIDSVVSDNSVSYNGGGLYLHASTLTLTDSVVSDNYGGSYSGGIWAGAGSVVSASGLELRGNQATSRGGGLYAHSSSVVTLSGGDVIADNTANHQGGGVFLAQSTLEMSGTQLSDNSATSAGGAIAAEDSAVSGEGCDFVDNAPEDLYIIDSAEGHELGEGADFSY